MIEKYSIPADHDGMRLDKWVKKNISQLPQSLIEKYLRIGKIKVNKKKIKSSYKLKSKDNIECYNIKKSEDNKKKKKYLPTRELLKNNEKDIIYNDENLIVVNKKPGIAVQSGTKSFKNLIDIYTKSEIFKNDKPYTVHRLDKDTSGILIIAKILQQVQLFGSSI